MLCWEHMGAILLSAREVGRKGQPRRSDLRWGHTLYPRVPIGGQWVCGHQGSPTSRITELDLHAGYADVLSS